jgi:hypothetical protein
VAGFGWKRSGGDPSRADGKHCVSAGRRPSARLRVSSDPASTSKRHTRTFGESRGILRAQPGAPALISPGIHPAQLSQRANSRTRSCHSDGSMRSPQIKRFLTGDEAAVYHRGHHQRDAILAAATIGGRRILNATNARKELGIERFGRAQRGGLRRYPVRERA